MIKKSENYICYKRRVRCHLSNSKAHKQARTWERFPDHCCFHSSGCGSAVPEPVLVNKELLTVQADVVVGENGWAVPPGSATHGDTHRAMHSLHILLLGESRKDLSGIAQVLQSCCRRPCRTRSTGSAPSQGLLHNPVLTPPALPMVGALGWHFTFGCHLLQSTDNCRSTQAASSNQMLRE